MGLSEAEIAARAGRVAQVARDFARSRYFWVGALGHHFGGAVAEEYGAWREMAAKDDGGEHDRAVIQISHFRAGAATDEALTDDYYDKDLETMVGAP